MKLVINIWDVSTSIERIDKTIENINNLRDEITDILPDDIVNAIVREGQIIANGYNRSAPKSGLVDNYTGKIQSKEGAGAIIMSGPNVIYDEFGTGEEGASQPHPLKNYYDLNPYNSGPFIFYNELAGRYQWRYGPMAGKPYFTNTGLTSGIPAGKMMYNTANDIRKIKNDIAAKKINKAIKKFK